MLFKLTLILFVICVVLVLAIVEKPYDISELEAFMSAAENCGGECLLGVRPGKTKVSEAMQFLYDNPWVGDVRQIAPGNGFSQIRWTWSGQQPAVIDTARDGRMTFFWAEEDGSSQPLSDSLIDTITVHTNMRMYSLQTILGETNSGGVSFRPDGHLAYSVSYDIPYGVLNLNVELSCPIHIMHYWNARARITMTIGLMDGNFVDPLDLPAICEET